MEPSIDDAYYNSNGFENYESNTNDPGPWMTIGVCIYSVSCVLVFLPLSVFLGRTYRKGKRPNFVTITKSDMFIDNKIQNDDDDDVLGLGGGGGGLTKSTSTSEKEESRIYRVTKNKSVDPEQQQVHHSRDKKQLSPKSIVIMPTIASSKKSSSSDQQQIQRRNEARVDLDSSRSLEEITSKHAGSEDEDVSKTIHQMTLFEETAGATSTASTFDSSSGSNCKTLCNIVSCDKETTRILNLGGPFTISAVSEATFDAIALAIVSKYLGVQSLSAIVLTHLLIGLTDTFIKGVSETLETLCPHAIGTENYNLAGQYAQIAVVIYILVSLPVAATWWFLMDDAIRLFGMDEEVVMIGHSYSKLLLGEYFVTGIFHTLFTLLQVSGYAPQVSILDIVEGSACLLTVWGLLHWIDEMTLFWVGVVELCVCITIYSLFTIFVVYKGWLDPFWYGMTKTFALKNIQAVKNVVGTAIPLALGTLLEYGEWQAFTFFAAALGPAEVVAWGILESIWDLFEAATEGLAEAGSMRLAFHLGKGNIPASKLSSWKTLFLSTILAVILSSTLFILSPYIPRWFTNDATLIEMVSEQLPLIGFGNIFMVFGMTSWALIGAQGRYKIATLVSATMTLFITLPLAALFCLGFRYSLISLVGALIIGYSTTGLCLGYILQMSEWEHISKNICDLNETYDMDCSSSDDDSDDDERGVDVFEDNA